MSTKRLTNHNGRKGKDGVYSAKHNDRNYDIKHSKAIEQRDRLSLLESIVADAGRALKALDEFLDEHTNIKYHSIIRQMVRKIADILSKAGAAEQETTRDIDHER